MSAVVWFRIFEVWFGLSVAAFAVMAVRGELAYRRRVRQDAEVARGVAYLRDYRDRDAS